MQASDARTILITGGAGFIGSNLVRHCLAAGCRVVNWDKLTYAGNLASLSDLVSNDRHHFVERDIADAPALATALREFRPDAIVHLAAESHVDRSIDGPTAFAMTNVVGTVELLRVVRAHWRELPAADRDRFRFLHFSTDEVYGSLGPTGSTREGTPYAPTSAYAASKAASDHFALSEHRTHGLPVVILRSTNIYGPYQFPEKLIPLMIRAAVAGRPLPIYGDGRQVRSWLHVEDVCRGIDAVLRSGRPGEEYHLGGPSEPTNREVVEMICELVDQLRPNVPHRPCSRLITSVKDRPGHDLRYSLDWTKIERELGWRPAWEFRAGLEQTVRWYLQHGDWVEAVTNNKYRGERLGLARS
jgi:dTDP-glucose 4,6-dehydratase